MRYVLLLALVLFAARAPAAVETFTLADGRTFVGEYDDELGQLHTTIGGKPASLAVAKEAIVERAVYRPRKAAQEAAKAAGDAPGQEAAPKRMTPEEAAAAKLEAAHAAKLREAESLEGAARKADRDAAGARSDAARKQVEAERHWEAFKKRAKAEGHNVDRKPDEKLIVLPKTAGNNRATIEALARVKQLEAQAEELDALAERKRAEADAARAAAASMPRAAKP